ncbi:hypothetical protein FQA39_LY17624 [Lamprigera yunnana]|nr:hypothetical protein FQA39_LY17624 [Lamprigera yunnana]
MIKYHSSLLCFIGLLVAVSSLKCYTYTCGSRENVSCSQVTHANVTCGIPMVGYQVVCSYVTIDHKGGGIDVETACDLVPLGTLEGKTLKRCVDEDLEGTVLHCKLCNHDMCNTPPN